MELEYRSARNFSTAEVQTVIQPELDRLKKLNKGDLPPSAVVDAARNPKAPLHKFFEWDDKIAGEKYREQQAREMIRAVTVYIPQSSKKPITTRAYVSVVKPTGQRTYKDVMDVIKQPDYRAQLLSQAIQELGAFKVKYAMLQEFCEAIDQILDRLKRGKR